jgi:hypothetical protein
MAHLERGLRAVEDGLERVARGTEHRELEERRRDRDSSLFRAPILMCRAISPRGAERRERERERERVVRRV